MLRLTVFLLAALLLVGCSHDNKSMTQVSSYSSGEPVITIDTDHHIFPDYNEQYTFTFTVSGEDLQYQWQEGFDWYDMQDISGATDPTYTKVMTRDDISKIYRCYVYNSYGSTTTIGCIVTDLNKLPPVITDISQDIQDSAGVEATLYIDGTGSAPLTCIWKKNGEIIQGFTEFGFTIESLQQSDAGTYTCELYNDYGSVLSNEIHVTVY